MKNINLLYQLGMTLFLQDVHLRTDSSELHSIFRHFSCLAKGVSVMTQDDQNGALQFHKYLIEQQKQNTVISGHCNVSLKYNQINLWK